MIIIKPCKRNTRSSTTAVLHTPPNDVCAATTRERCRTASGDSTVLTKKTSPSALRANSSLSQGSRKDDLSTHPDVQGSLKSLSAANEEAIKPCKSGKSDGNDDDTKDEIFFAQQVVPNSCATHALLSILMNRPELDLGLMLTEFRKATKRLSPETKGLAIGSMPPLAHAHNRHATGRHQPALLSLVGSSSSSLIALQCPLDLPTSLLEPNDPMTNVLEASQAAATAVSTALAAAGRSGNEHFSDTSSTHFTDNFSPGDFEGHTPVGRSTLHILSSGSTAGIGASISAPSTNLSLSVSPSLALPLGGNVEPPDTFHFVCFLPIRGRLYELDGLKSAPIDHGPLIYAEGSYSESGSEGNWTAQCAELLKQRMIEASKVGFIF
ncbi:unnamed protein product [Protopolystoma xenopodis]|uniref:ubiquitinyl hydrolase 1 n=1 Tax=Protopolystoma xenopodis TaxID=117903 RepID=A0A448X0J2_9PLAT|nr:unnamed protein product [Protopolystoma xenopodis]